MMRAYMDKESKLSSEDMQRVEKYLNSGFNRSQRKPFRPLLLLLVIWIVVAVLGGISWYIGKESGFL
jgi:hypothetical protein